jgi:pilus assembly protein CpaC
LKDGQSFGIAGLLDQRITTQFSKVPGIGDLPILGQFFRSRSINKTDSELVVIVTPTIVDFAGPSAAAAAATLPKMPIAPLDTKQFDTKISSGHWGGSK